MKHITDGSKKLYTRRELCEAWGYTTTQFDDRKQKYGWEPVSKAVPAGGTKPELLYDKEACEDLEKEKRLLEEEERRLSLTQRKANGLAEDVKGAVMTLEIEKLDSDDSDEGIKACMVNAAGFMAMLNRKIERLNDKNKALSEQVQRLECELDIAAGQMTVETYAIRVLGSPVSRATASKITRWLHKQGHEDLGKVLSKTDPGMMATVWSIKQLDVADEQGLFNG